LLDSKQIAAIKPIIDELAPKLNAYLNSIGRESGRQPLTTNN